MKKPNLIVVTGRPGSGKTTLAHALASEIRCPALCRDEFKEGLVNTTGEKGSGGGEVDRHVYAAFFESIELLLRKRITLVAEAAFQHRVWVPKLEHLSTLAEVRIVLCQVPAELAFNRHKERSAADPRRERYHHDHEAQIQGITPYEPPRLNVPTLEVDTSNELRPRLEDIVRFAMS